MSPSDKKRDPTAEEIWAGAYGQEPTAEQIWATGVGPAKGVKFDPWGAGLKKGTGQLAENVGGTGQMASQIAFGEEVVGKDLTAWGKKLQEGETATNNLEDIRGGSDFLAWAGNAILSQVPQYGANLAGAGVGMVVGGLAGGPAGAATGMEAGSATMAALQNFGETYLGTREAMEDELKRQGITDPEAFRHARDQAALIALPGGLGNTILDTIEPTRTAGTLGGLTWKPVVRAEGKYLRGAVKEVAKEFGEGAAKEFVTEGLQETTGVATEQAGREWIASQGTRPAFTPGAGVVASRVLNAAATGAVTGGAFSAAAQAREEYKNKPIIIDPEEVATELKPGWMKERRQEEYEEDIAPTSAPPSTTPPPPPGTVPVPEEKQLLFEFPAPPKREEEDEDYDGGFGPEPPPMDEEDLSAWEPEPDLTPPPQIDVPPGTEPEPVPPVTSTVSNQPAPVVLPPTHVVTNLPPTGLQGNPQLKDHGQVVWDSMLDAPKLGHYPIVDEDGLFAQEEQEELTGVEPGMSFLGFKKPGVSGKLMEYMRLSDTLLKKMIAVAGRMVPGHTPISNTALALQLSDKPWTSLSVGQSGNWMFAVSPLAQTGKTFAENTWDQLEHAVITAINNGDPDAIAANEVKLSNGLKVMKDAYLKAYNKLPIGQTGGLVALEGTYQQRQKFMSGLDPFVQTIKVSNRVDETGSKYGTAVAVQQQVGVVSSAPKTDNGTRVIGPSHSTAVIESLKGHPLLNRVGAVFDEVITTLANALEKSYPKYKGIVQRMDRAAVLLPWQPEPAVHRGQWWPTNEAIGRFLVSANPWGWMTQQTANPDPNPRNTAVGLIGTMQHELVHSLVWGHGTEFHKAHEEVLDAIAATVDVHGLIDLLESIYADPKRPGEFNPELYTLYSQITAGYPTGYLHEPERLGPKGRATQPAGPSTGGPGTQPGVGGGPGPSGLTPSVGASEGYTGEELGDEGGYGWGSTGDNFFYPTTSPWLQGTQPLGPVAAADLDANTNQAVMEAEKAGLSKGAQQDMAHYGLLTRWWQTLLQIAKKNPDVWPFQAYKKHVEDFWARKNKISQIAEVVLREWGKLGGKWGVSKHAKDAAEFLMRVSEQSERLRRRLTQAEKSALAAQMKVHPDVVKHAEKVWATLREALDRLEQAQKDHVDRTYPNDPALVKGRKQVITKEFNRLRRRDYFPFSRFGKYAIVVKAKTGLMYQGKRHRKGQIMRLEAWESEQEGKVAYNDLLNQFKGQQVEVYKKWLEDIDYIWSGFPPSLYKDLSSKLGLDPSRSKELREVFLSRSPGSGFVKHLMRRRGVAGMSRDAMRGFADYMMHISNHIARLEKGWEMEQAIDDMDTFIDANPSWEAGKIKSHMARHYQYLMKPDGDMAWLRGWMFNWFFAWNPKQVLVNFMQIPQFAYPYLGKRYGGWAAARELGKAIKDTAHPFTSEESWEKKMAKISPSEDRLFQRGQEAGFLNESYATEVGARASGGLSGKTVRRARGFLGRPGRAIGKALETANIDQFVRHAIDLGTSMFKLSEDLNRRIVFMATIRLAKAKGATEEEQFQRGKEAVQASMFEYARWNKPEIMRGNLGALFVFKTYLQHALHFAWSNEGGWRFWVMTLIIAGMRGIPGADHALELLNWALTTIKKKTGMKDPMVDLEKEARLFIESLGGNPSAFMDGLSKYTFGLGALHWVPNLDFSASVQLGRFLPTKGFIQGMRGSMDRKEAIATIMTDIIGAPGTVMTNMMEGVFDDSPQGHRLLRGITPAGIRNLMEAYWMLSDEGYKDNQGNELINTDIHNPLHFMEVMGRLFGVAPTRLREVQEGMSAEKQVTIFYQSMRQYLLRQYDAASTREEQAEAVKDMIEFNKTAPPAFGIKTSQANQSAKIRAKNRGLVERGMPLKKDFLPLYREYRKAWPRDKPALP